MRAAPKPEGLKNFECSILNRLRFAPLVAALSDQQLCWCTKQHWEGVMSSLEQASRHDHRHATLKLSNTEDGQVLTASLPGSLSREDFGKVATTAYDLIFKLTACPCGSGRIKFLVDDLALSEIVEVELGPAI
jgi:hypothetical protein